MELASMLAGERFTDHPRSVCPIVGALMRAYNDAVDDTRRQDLYRYVSECVGTRGTYAVERRRAERALAAARPRGEARRQRWLGLIPRVTAPDVEASPDSIARHVVGSIRRHTDETHASMLALLDELLAMTIARRPRVASTSSAGTEQNQPADHDPDAQPLTGAGALA
jgi:hypothetical protein